MCAAGLDGLAALDVLDVHHNSIADAAPVAALTSLRILNLSSNRVAVLPQLSALTSLAELNVRRNCLSSLHFGAPSSLPDGGTTMDSGSLSGIGDVEALAEPANAGEGEGTLDAGGFSVGVGVRDAIGLPPCLQRLFASHNKVAAIGDVPVLRALTQLRELALDANPLMNATHEIVRCLCAQTREGIMHDGYHGTLAATHDGHLALDFIFTFARIWLFIMSTLPRRVTPQPKPA